MSLCGSPEDKKKLVSRLHRIEGQVRGLATMVEDDRDCIDVLHQVGSVSGALRGVWLQLVNEHMHGCVQRAIKEDGDSDAIVDELMNHLKQIC